MTSTVDENLKYILSFGNLKEEEAIQWISTIRKKTNKEKEKLEQLNEIRSMIDLLDDKELKKIKQKINKKLNNIVWN